MAPRLRALAALLPAFWGLAGAFSMSGRRRSGRSFAVASEDVMAELPAEGKFTITENSRRIQLRAAKTAEKRVTEVNAPLEEYLRLPASEYSVLDGDWIDRLDESHFKCKLPTLTMFGNPIAPVIYVAVLVEPEVPRARIIVERADLEGGPAAAAANGTFIITCENCVTMIRPELDDEEKAAAERFEEDGGSEGGLRGLFRSDKRADDRRQRKLQPILRSAVSLDIEARVPDESKLPVKVMERVASLVLQASFSLTVPRFVGLLAKDFNMWSTDGSRYFGGD